MNRELMTSLRIAYEQGATAPWEDILDHRPALALPAASLLEASTDDTYLAVTTESLEGIDDDNDRE